MNEKLERLRNALIEAETNRDKFSSGTTRRNDWEREVQRIKNIIHKLENTK